LEDKFNLKVAEGIKPASSFRDLLSREREELIIL
jgi:hypothetical protein